MTFVDTPVKYSQRTNRDDTDSDTDPDSDGNRKPENDRLAKRCRAALATAVHDAYGAIQRKVRLCVLF
jgi:hypothetical protein